MKSAAEDLFEMILRERYVAIERMVANQELEGLFLDYKRIATPLHQKGLHDTDWNNLAVAISGFGNSDGGVIVWGIDCRKDKATGKETVTYACIADTGWFLSLIDARVGQVTSPLLPGVRSVAIDLPNQGGGVVVTFVPEGQSSPISSNRTEAYGYFMRAGTQFLQVPHNLLAGMFGKRPQPKLAVRLQLQDPWLQSGNKTVEVTFLAIISNFGRGFASSVYFALDQLSMETAEIRGDSASHTSWTFYHSEVQIVYVTHPGFVGLAPGTAIKTPAKIRLILGKHESAVRLSGFAGCLEGPSAPVAIDFSAETLRFVHENLSYKWTDPAQGEASRRLVVEKLLDALGQKTRDIGLA